MSTTVVIPTPLRPYTSDQRTDPAEGATVGEVLTNLLLAHAGLREHLLAQDGRLRSFVNIYVNDDDIRYLAGEQTPVGPSDTISIVPSVAGGSSALGRTTVAELPSLRRLLLFDALRMDVRVLKLRRNLSCPVCGDRPTIRSLIDDEQFCGVGATAEAAGEAVFPSEWQTTVEELKANPDRREDIWILDVRESSEFDICRIPGSTLIPLGELSSGLRGSTRLSVRPDPQS